jgi:hypothetical protein
MSLMHNSITMNLIHKAIDKIFKTFDIGPLKDSSFFVFIVNEEV